MKKLILGSGSPRRRELLSELGFSFEVRTKDTDESCDGVPANEQGELQGSLTSIISITSIVGPLVMSNFFDFFTGPIAPFYFPGAPFMLAAVLMLLSCFFAYKALRTK